MRAIKRLFISIISVGCFFISLNAKEIHVAKTGNDNNAGTINAPLLTISKAANVAEPGDTIFIHEGTYREYVDPPRGGTSEDMRIIYKAAEGEEVYVKGSEQINNWTDNGDSTWSVVLSSDFFNGYNPFNLYVDGDYQNFGYWHHRGDVYINNGALAELQTLDQVKKEPYTWFTITDGDETTIYANFGTENPNNELTEINVRELIFFANKQGINYITIDGIRFLHAAPNWQAPNESFSTVGRLTQVGAVGAHLGKWWIIENCEVMYSKTAGIMFGESESAEHEEDITKFGDHIIRNNVISRCGEYGIAGQKGLARSTISGNRIEDINYRVEFGGWETAGIKIWNCVDVLIENNLIRRVSTDLTESASSFCIWIDFANQGTRITRNFLEGSPRTNTALYLEANVGPTLVDNNIIVEENNRSIMVQSGGSIFAHNLFINSNFYFSIQQFDNGGSGARQAYTLKPHTMEITNIGQKVELEYNQLYNNIFAGAQGPINFSSNSGTGNIVDNNLYIDGTTPANAHTNPYVSSFDFTHSISNTDNGLDFSFEFDTSFSGLSTPVVNADLVGVIPYASQTIEDKEANPITVNYDFNMLDRSDKNPVIGPLENIVKGTNSISINTTILPTPGGMYDVPVSIPPSDTVPQTPFLGIPFEIPGIIEAEEYDLGGQGVSYNDDDIKDGDRTIRPDDNVDMGSDDTGTGTVIGWFANNEWLEYTVNIQSGNYTIEVRTASAQANPGSLKLSINDKNIATIDITTTNDWDTYKTISVNNINISEATEAVLRATSTGGFNLDRITFIRDGDITNLEKIAMTRAKIYPIPVNDILFIEPTLENNPLVKIFSSDGKLIIVESDTKIDVSQLKPGIYFIKINNQAPQKFIKN